MKRKLKIAEVINSRSGYKRKFSFREMARAFAQIPGAAAAMLGNKKRKLLAKDFIERLQLAVTEVNGCAACSYAHAYLALKQGLSNEEINSFLSGDGNFIRQDEAKAIAFAQHFADARGLPRKDAYRALENEYGQEKAKVIHAAAQLMMAGNIYGIPYSAFQSRLRGKPYRDSSLAYELGMQAAGFVILPIALVYGLIRTVLGFSNIRLDESAASRQE